MSISSNSATATLLEHRQAISLLSGDLERSKDQIRCLEGEKRKLEEEQMKSRINTNRLQQTISMLEESKLRHSSQFDAIREQLEEAELHASNLQHQLDVNLAQLKGKDEEHIKLEAQLTEAVQQLETDKMMLQDQLDDKVHNYKLLEETNNEIQAELSSIKLQMYRDEMSREENRRKIADLTTELQTVRFDLEDAQAENERLKTKQKDFEEALIKSEGSLSATKERAVEDHSVNSRKIAELNKLVRELETERRDLELNLSTTEEAHVATETELSRREGMRRNLQSKLSHLISMLYATLPGISGQPPRIKLALNDDGDSTDIEFDQSYNRDHSRSYQSEHTHSVGLSQRSRSPLPAEDAAVIDVESVRQAILTMKKQGATHDSECKSLKSNLESTKQSYSETKDKLSSLSKENRALQDKVVVLEKERSMYREQADNSRASLSSIEVSRSELQKQLETAEKRRTSAEKQHVILKEEIDSNSKNTESLEKQLNEVTVQRNEALNDISDWRAKCVDVQSSRSGIETEYGKLQAQLTELLIEKEELQTRLEHVHQTLEESEKEKAKLQLNVTRLQKSADQTTAKLATLEETVEDMDKRLKQYREENVMLKQKIASGTDLQTLIKKEKHVADVRCETLERECQDYKLRLQTLQERLARAQASVTDNEMSRIKAEGQIRSASLALQQKSGELRNAVAQIDRASDDQLQLQNTISNLSGQVNALEKEKRLLMEEKMQSDTEARLHNQSNDALRNEISHIQELLNKSEKEKVETESKLNQTAVQAERAGRRLKKLELTLDDTEESTKSKVTRAEERHRRELTRELEKSRNNESLLGVERVRSEELRQKINDLQDQIATLNVTVHRQEASKKSYQDRMQTKTDEVKDLRNLLNETYSLATPAGPGSPDMESTRFPSSAYMSRSPSRGSPTRNSPIMSPLRRSPSPVRRRRFRETSPTNRGNRTSPTPQYTKHRSQPQFSGESDNPSDSSKRQDLSDIAERSHDNLNISKNASLVCNRCRSPVGLTLEVV